MMGVKAGGACRKLEDGVNRKSCNVEKRHAEPTIYASQHEMGSDGRRNSAS